MPGSINNRFILYKTINYIYLQTERWPKIPLIPYTARSIDAVCNILHVLTPAHTGFSFYLWLSCCDHPQGSISVSHFCSCAQTVPSIQVHQGCLKTITTTWLQKITETSISVAKNIKGTNALSNHPEYQRMWSKIHKAAIISFILIMLKICSKCDRQKRHCINKAMVCMFVACFSFLTP